MQIHSVGIDLGKTTFHLVALGDHGKVLLKKKFTQRQLITFTANLQTSLDRGGGVLWSRTFWAVRCEAQGHEPRSRFLRSLRSHLLKSNKERLRSMRRRSPKLVDS